MKKSIIISLSLIVAVNFGYTQVQDEIPPPKRDPGLPLSHERDEKPADNYEHLKATLIGEDKMVFIEGGTYEMGFKKGRDSRNNNSELRLVTLDSFHISQFEVTVGEFREFVDSMKYETVVEKYGTCSVFENKVLLKNQKDYSWKSINFDQTDNHPVTCISWFDAVEYCNWLSEKHGLEKCYNIEKKTYSINVECNWEANGYRLPTEAEWEYAARGGKLSGGHRYAGTSDDALLHRYSNYSGDKDSVNHTSSVGSFQPNEIFLYDMSGNVSEWCWDKSGVDRKISPVENPKGSDLSYRQERVIKGGNWTTFLMVMEVSRHQYSLPINGYSHIGFRLCRKVE
ncbi:MAG: formylglycine-generating enzyme family protein [Bacteroidetes bacterium]|nr:formylglycine-generating enzyme family protein [Bacteroidota bacterium]MCB0844780.1 formylglycine-generating enzyme family protein [Bacteroidota bacterium]